MQEKFALKSKGILGALSVLLGVAIQVLPLAGLQISLVPDEVIRPLALMLEGVGGFLALYGRAKAGSVIVWRKPQED